MYNPKIIILIGVGLLIAAGVIMFLYNLILIRYLLLVAIGIVAIVKRGTIIKCIKVLRSQ